MPNKERARVARTLAFMDKEKRPAFMSNLAKEIASHIRRSKKHGMVPAVRLNATSDIKWESVPVDYDGKTYQNIMRVFPDVYFYDYTKVMKRVLKSLSDPDWPENYTLTFSLSEDNDREAAEVLRAGGNVAVVFNTKRSQSFPASYTIGGVTAPVVSGDEHDFRPLDPKGVIVGLHAKGKAIYDKSGFVRQV